MFAVSLEVFFFCSFLRSMYSSESFQWSRAVAFGFAFSCFYDRKFSPNRDASFMIRCNKLTYIYIYLIISAFSEKKAFLGEISTAKILVSNNGRDSWNCTCIQYMYICTFGHLILIAVIIWIFEVFFFNLYEYIYGYIKKYIK